MAIRVLRRNRRAQRKTHYPQSARALFAISLVICASGIGSLAWALEGPASTAEPPPAAPVSSGNEDAMSPYTGLIVSGQNPKTSESANASSSTAPAAPQEETAPAPETAAIPEAEPVGAPEPEPTYEPASNAVPEPEPEPAYAPAPAQQQASERQGSVIHHEATRKNEVYRTVHHQASSMREVNVDGKAKLEWTKCPVCGQVHQSAYNERILDHVNETKCPACGQSHAASYDELVYE